jgi:hypothetical protein
MRVNATTATYLVLQSTRDRVQIQLDSDTPYREIPKAITFQGKVFGRTGWNSDTWKAEYSLNRPVAVDVLA